MIEPHIALQILRDGNHRYAHDLPSESALRNEKRRAALVMRQRPKAIILGCSDSRAPAELIFDQGLGDLFVIRVAGNIVLPSQIGSVEYAAEQTGCRLVVVMGHTGCGAVTATLEAIEDPQSTPSANTNSIISRIRPTVSALMNDPELETREAILERAVRDNVKKSVEDLRHGSDTLRTLIEKDRLMIVGAEYSLATGVVDFFDGVGEPSGANPS